jgi:hypothetical protein
MNSSQSVTRYHQVLRLSASALYDREDLTADEVSTSRSDADLPRRNQANDRPKANPASAVLQ